MIFKNISIVFFLLLTTYCVSAQSTEPINTDRPDQSDGAYVLEKNKFQIENGITISDKTLLNNFMLRYGFTKSAEVRIELDAGRFEDKNGLLPVTFSVKQRIIEQKKIIPAITLVGYLGFEQLAGKNFSGHGLPAAIVLAFENEVSPKISLGYNIGTATWFKNLNLTFGIGYITEKKLSFFAEYFSSFHKKEVPQHNFDIGAQYLIRNNLQFDIAAGHSLFDKDKRMFITTGFAYRFN